MTLSDSAKIVKGVTLEIKDPDGDPRTVIEISAGAG